uniref:Caspase family p20 domain-containing protein n=2 Tax=Esox lucius TaxID=8010 RepID=A0A3P8Y1G1_ESOLU
MEMRPGSYEMSGERQALMLCVRYKEKINENNCFEVDHQTMKKFFEEFGFQYHIVLDKNVEDMHKAVEDFRDHINHSRTNISCVLVVTSCHGGQDTIQDARGKTLDVEHIIKPFGDESCPKMKGQPKIFIIDTCRGSNNDTGVESGSIVDFKLSNEAIATTEYRASRVSPCINDMLVAYAAMTDYTAWMNSFVGSYMIHNITQVFSSRDAAQEHMYDLFVKANAKLVEKTMQLSDDKGKQRFKSIMTIESTLRKLIYLGRKTHTGIKE